ncbi:hypothetical protein [Micromonospora craterilacus]|uniref:hypothetical protein n=1 Tax=Micromonospora craterilacus TaxID=1655439 RepID=UPI0011B6DB10|nr:hypothetical protein [Micromonospora craterilacus]
MKPSRLPARSAKRAAADAAAGVFRRSTLNRVAGLARTGGPNRSGQLAQSSFKPARWVDTGPTVEVEAIVDRRSGGWCEWPGCRRPQVDRHHRLNRKIGGRHGAARERINGVPWLLGACRPHHDFVTNPTGDDRVLAESMGWLLREHQDAAATPVLTRHRPEPVLLTADGDWTPVVAA